MDNMRFSQQLFLTFLFHFLSTCGIAQTIDSNHVDGRVYLKVWDTSSVILDPYANDIPALNQVMIDYQVTEMIRAFKTAGSSLQQVYRLSFSDWADIDNMLLELEAMPFVEYAEAAPLFRISALPSDYDSTVQWHLAKIQAPLAWEAANGSAAVTIAIVDNAVRWQHEDLQSNTWTNPNEVANNLIDDDFNGFTDDVRGYDVADDDNTPSPPAGTLNASAFIHGTHCAGIASATTDNSIGIASIGYAVSIIPVKCSPDSDSGTVLTHAYEGVDYALSAGADIISMSFGSSESFSTFGLLSNQAQTQGALLIAAAGNKGTTERQYPAAYDGVFAVGASDASDKRAGFSTYGDWIDVMAPGVNIYSSMPEGDNTYGLRSGSSMACPLVAGLAGLVWSADNALSVSQVKAFIEDGCTPIDDLNPGAEGQLGAGRIDAYGTLVAMGVAGLGKHNTAGLALQVHPNPVHDLLHIRLADGEPVTDIEITTMTGQSVYKAYRGTDIDVSILPSGTYILSVATKDERWVTRFIHH